MIDIMQIIKKDMTNLHRILDERHHIADRMVPFWIPWPPFQTIRRVMPFITSIITGIMPAHDAVDEQVGSG